MQTLHVSKYVGWIIRYEASMEAVDGTAISVTNREIAEMGKEEERGESGV
jgi:hypothetical protein